MPRNTRTLILNADYQAFGVISWKRAVILSFINLEDSNKGLKIIEHYCDDIIHSQYESYNVPAVGVSPFFIKQHKQTVPFSRKNIFIRDGLTCAYCHKQFPPNELEYDHLHPRSKYPDEKGGPTHWLNIVSCCKRCNRIKADKTLKECGFTLLKQPIIPKASSFVRGITPWQVLPDVWLKYLPKHYIDINQKFCHRKNMPT